MPNFDPAQELPADSTVQTVPLSLPNQFGAVVAGTPTNPNIAPSGNPRDVVINSAGIVDPSLRAAYVAAHPVVVPIASPAPIDPGVAPLPVATTVPGTPPALQVPSKGSGAGGGAGGLPSADITEAENLTKQGLSDQQAAYKNFQETQERNSANEREAFEAKQETERQQRADLAAQQLFVRERQKALNEDDQRNYQVARDRVIPDFWEGREGKLAGAAITVGLSGAAAALLGSTNNTAQQAIQHNVDSYYSREKEKVDNLYKYAEQKGRLNENMRQQYAGELTDLMQQHALTLQSAADRIQQVAAESKNATAIANAGVMASGLKEDAAKGLLATQGARTTLYNAKSQRMEAGAAVTRANAEATKANGEAGEKADEAAFRTYVQGPHGKDAQEITRRVEALRSAATDIDNAKSVGEVTAQIDKAIAADAGQGTRGVSMGQLHTILPKLVSATGEISNAVSQGWDGSAGKEFRAAAKRLISVPLASREGEYRQRGDDLEKNLALTPHAQKNPAFSKSSRLQLYPDLGPSPTAGPALPAGVPVGSTLAGTSKGAPVYRTPDGRLFQP